MLPFIALRSQSFIPIGSCRTGSISFGLTGTTGGIIGIGSITSGLIGVGVGTAIAGGATGVEVELLL